MHDNQTIEQIIDGCLKNEAKYQELLYKTFSAQLFSICVGYTKNKEEAKDLLQEGFIRIFKNIHSFQNEAPLFVWMRKIVVNTAIDYYRKSLKKIRTSELNADIEHSDFSINLQQFDLNYFKSIISKMPDGYRIIFNLYVVEGYNHREIAELTGISEGTSKSQFSRARKHLQDIILRENNHVKERVNYYGKSTFQLV